MVHHDLAVVDFFGKVKRNLRAYLLFRVLLHGSKQLFCVFLHFFDCKRVGGVEGQRNHALLSGEVDFYHAVVIRRVGRFKLLEISRLAVLGVIFLNLVVRNPY